MEYATWEISCDGWYPYCSKCFGEPSWDYQKKSAETTGYYLFNVCPNCGAKMKNYKDFKERRN